MLKTYDKCLGTMKTALLALDPTGATGFEGLVQVVLSKLTGIPFRLASSGLQGGIDGAPALSGDAVSFEAKRYDNNLSSTDVVAKIADFSRGERSADRLWILGATTSVGAQLSDKVHQDGNTHALSTLILDWTSAPLPLLAVAVAAAEDAALEFILKHADQPPSKHELEQSFADIRANADFDPLLQRLIANFNVTQLATKRAVDQNHAWHAEAFTSRDKAMERFGQALTVATAQGPTLRTTLRQTVEQTLNDSKVAVLGGDEGQGKSWLAAQICHAHDGLSLFISAENFNGVSPTNISEFLIKLLIKQSGEVETEALTARWRHRIAAWEQTPPTSPLLVVVDGINQRRSLRWDRLLDSLAAKLRDIGGQLIVTTRPQYWHKQVAVGVSFTHKLIDIPNWDTQERDALLAYHGIKTDWLDATTLETLRNPRLLSVAIATLPKERSQSWTSLTTDRLLFEHLRKSQAENFEEESLHDLTNRLSGHARQVLERVQASSNMPPQHFEADSADVIETRFFKTLDGPGQTYELHNDGLTLALGYSLVDQLWQARRQNHDLTDRMAQLADPIQAMDRTVDVIFAALMVASLDTIRFHPDIFATLLDAFANVQNLDEARFEEFVEILHHQPNALFAALKTYCLERGGRINYDWLVHAAFEISNTEEGWKTAQGAVHNWLRCYNADADNQASRYHRSTDPEGAKQRQRLADEIDTVLSALSPTEQELLDGMEPVSGDTSRLYELALQLLAGRPLAGFADSFVTLGLGLALDRSSHRAHKAFDQLTKFNRADPNLAKPAFLRAIDPLRQKVTSTSGRWTLVRMLFATGGEKEANEAAKQAKELRDPWPWPAQDPNAWRQVNVADPTAPIPTDFAEGLANFKALDTDKMLCAMSSSIEDHNFEEFLPVACRFDQTAAVEKGRKILSGLLSREGLPMRQLLFIGAYLAPLMSDDLARQAVVRFAEPDFPSKLPEQSRDILKMWAYRLVAPHLTAQEQLACLQSGDFGDQYSLDAIPSFKPQPADAIIAALETQLGSRNDNAVFGVLAAAQYGGTPTTPDLEKLLLRCLSSQSSLVRAACFELAARHGLDTVRQAHVQGNWVAKDHDRDTYEGWHGASLLIDAAVREELPLADLLSRIDRRTWFDAAKRLGTPCRAAIRDLFLQQLKAAAAQVSTLAPPSVDIELNRKHPLPYPMMSIRETNRGQGRFPPETSIADMLGGGESFDDAQRRRHAIASDFFDSIENTEARHLMREISLSDLHLLETEDPTFLPQIARLLEQLTDGDFIWFQNLAFAVANLISEADPARAVSLFERAIMTDGFLPLGLGDELTFEHEALWSATPSDAVHGLWRKRIMTSVNDAALAREVLAAERFGAADFIENLIQDLAARPSPLDKAYALTIAGYSIQSSAHLDLINGHLNDNGPTGPAAQAAKAAHEAHQWASGHAEALWKATTAEDAFAQLMITKTCLDARTPAEPSAKSPWAAYGPIFRSLREKALKNRTKDREKLLLGADAPASLFLAGS